MYGTTSHTLIEATRKAEHFCVYQERCHQEVVTKLQSLRMIPEVIDLILVHLIEHDFLNETRFACSFTRGKHRIKHWGKIRIVRELKMRGISDYNIKEGLKEITDEYYDNFEQFADRHWEHMQKENKLTKRKKFCDFLLRKGFESDLVYAKVKELETANP